MGNKHTKIKLPPTEKGRLIKTPDLIEMEDFDYPVFCVKHTVKGYGIKDCGNDDKHAFIDKVFQLSQMTWEQIRQAPRHGSGTEKISRGSLKFMVPPFITDDVDHLLALRFSGKKPMLVHRHRFIMHVIALDHDFSAYNH